MAQAISEALQRGLRNVGELRGPPGWPLIGSLANVDASRMHEQLERWVGQYGPMYRVALGPHTMLVVSQPELVLSVLRGRPDAWRRIDKLRDVLREAGVHGLFSAEGGEWRRQRRLVMEAFDPGHLKRYFESLALTTGRLLRRFEQSARSGEPIELQPTLMRYTVDVTTGLAFGADLNTLEQPGHALQRHLNTIFPMLMRRLNAPLPYWRFVKLPADRAFDRQLAVVHAAVRAFVRETRARVEREPRLRDQPQNLLQAMVAARDDSGAALSEEELLGNVLTVLLAGQDTTANTMCWMLHHLHADRGAWAEVVAECDAALAPAPLAGGFESTRTLDAVERCASETMRLRPVAPFLFLQNNAPAVLGDVRLPADSSVICLLRHAATDERLSADAREFRPGRWRDDGAGAAAATEAQRELLRASMPFGAGPRLCPGRYLALLEIKMVISMLARNFELVEVATEHGAAPRERLEFTMCPERLTMRLRPRAQNASRPC